MSSPRRTAHGGTWGMTDSAFSGPKGVPPLEYCWSFAIRTLAAAAGVKATPSLRKEDCGVAPLGTSDRSLRVAGDRKFLTPRGRERHHPDCCSEFRKLRIQLQFIDLTRHRGVTFALHGKSGTVSEEILPKVKKYSFCSRGRTARIPCEIVRVRSLMPHDC
jgi:hypothetical protein